jgi:hypothetical protein
MDLPGAAPIPGGSDREAQTAVSGLDRAAGGAPKTSGSTLRKRLEKWIDDIGYWGEASKVLIGESIATDYSPPRTTATFGLGPLSFHCVQDDETGDFRVRLEGSTIPHIPDRATLERAVEESEHAPDR